MICPEPRKKIECGVNCDQALLAAAGKVIRAWRRECNLSQEALGNLSGFRRTYICDVERGTRNFTISSLRDIAHPLGLSLSELLALAEEYVLTGVLAQFRPEPVRLAPGIVEPGSREFRLERLRKVHLASARKNREPGGRNDPGKVKSRVKVLKIRRLERQSR